MTDVTHRWSELRFEFEFSPDHVDPRSDEVNVLDDAFIGRLTVSGLPDAGTGGQPCLEHRNEFRRLLSDYA